MSFQDLLNNFQNEIDGDNLFSRKSENQWLNQNRSTI